MLFIQISRRCLSYFQFIRLFITANSEFFYSGTNEKNIDVFSLEQLDQLLLNTTYENNYQDCLFIVHDTYLVMSMIDFDENSERVLQQSYDYTPLIIIPMDNIINVRSIGIVCHNNNFSPYISFSTYIHNINFNPIPWLHKRLISLNDQYRFKYV